MSAKRQITAVIIELVAIGFYFTPLYIDQNSVNINGFKAMQLYWITTVLFVLMTMILIANLIGLFNQSLYERYEKILVTIINIQIVISALLITFFSYIVNMYTYILTAIIILSIYNQYKIKT